MWTQAAQKSSLPSPPAAGHNLPRPILSLCSNLRNPPENGACTAQPCNSTPHSQPPGRRMLTVLAARSASMCNIPWPSEVTGAGGLFPAPGKEESSSSSKAVSPCQCPSGLGLTLSVCVGFPGEESACQCSRGWFDLGLGRSSGGGNGYTSSILAWGTPWTEQPGGLQSMGPQSWTQITN